MKNAFLVLLLLTVASCKKTAHNDSPVSIEGTWKMILVKTNDSNIALTKPSSIEGDVVISFVPNSDTTGTFSGRTPTNEITGFGYWFNVYTLGPSETISIPGLSMTKVGETSWGYEFVNNITKAQQYSFSNAAKLNIHTADKTLVFERQ